MQKFSKPAASLIRALDSAFLKALADPARQQIICILAQGGNMDVSSISANLTQERSVVSRHLKVLGEAGIVRSEKMGRQVIYRLNGNDIIAHIEHLLSQLKAAMKNCCK